MPGIRQEEEAGMGDRFVQAHGMLRRIYRSVGFACQEDKRNAQFGITRHDGRQGLEARRILLSKQPGLIRPPLPERLGHSCVFRRHGIGRKRQMLIAFGVVAVSRSLCATDCQSQP